jgi:F0F1-type ATP synthase alpha subunit
LSKKLKIRKNIENIIFTGQPLIDHVKPLYEGNFNILKGDRKNGPQEILLNTMLNFVSRCEERERQNFLIYVTYSKTESTKLKELLKKQNVNDKNFYILSLSDAKSDINYYYLLRFAFGLIKQIKDEQNKALLNNYSILFCFDDVITYLMKEKSVFTTAKMNMVYKLLISYVVKL